MKLDIALILGVVLFTVLLALVGVEMANNPPATKKTKRVYRSAFYASAFLLIITTLWQGKRNIDEQARINNEALADRRIGEARYNQLQGKLENITQFVEHPPAGFTQEQVNAVVRTMVKSIPKPAP